MRTPQPRDERRTLVPHPVPATTPLRRAASALRDAVHRVDDRLDAHTAATHRPTSDDSSAWCTSHWGRLTAWPCPEYTEAVASLEARRRS